MVPSGKTSEAVKRGGKASPSVAKCGLRGPGISRIDGFWWSDGAAIFGVPDGPAKLKGEGL